MRGSGEMKVGSFHLVIFLSRRIQTGGQRYLAEVFSYLQHHGVRVTPIYLDDYPRWPRKLGIVADSLINNVWFLWQVTRVPDVEWPAVVFFEDVYYRHRLLLFNLLIQFFAGLPRVVVLVQNVLADRQLLQNRAFRRVDNLLVRLFFRQANLVFTNSEFIRQRVLSRGVAPDKTRVIYCGYDRLDDSTVKDAGIPRLNQKTLHILFVGQCEPYKGVDVLIRALGQLEHTDEYSVAVDVVGNTTVNDAYYRLLVRIIDDEGLSEQIHFWGHVDDKARLRRFYEQADIFVLPSRYEGFGIVLLEAMSFGLPIVATTAGAIPELVEDGVHGLLVPADDPHSLAQAIEKLLRSPDARMKYGQNGYRFAQSRARFYGWEAVGERIMSHLLSLLPAA